MQKENFYSFTKNHLAPIKLLAGSKSLLLLAFIALFQFANSQTIQSWQWKDLKNDHIYGISLEKAKQNLSTTPAPSPIIIAIMDGGIDTNHLTLKSKLWNNLSEIPNNQIDDDHNGYIDDIHGWNFLGGKDGRNINKASDEKSRVYHAYKQLYLNKEVDSSKMNFKEKLQYRNWLAASNEIIFTEEDRLNLEYIRDIRNVLNRVGNTLAKEMEDNNFSLQKLTDFEPIGRNGLNAKIVFLKTIRTLGIEDVANFKDIISDLDEYIESKDKLATALEKAPEPIRENIVKDNYNDFNDKYYGNNDIMGPNAKHGTHVAGLASYEADYVKIMGIRVVPDGDEYDKDIALGIRYAVDNGAKIINMSFGKSFSPQQPWVDSAIRYAASKDVLIIHSAGNEKYNLNTKSVYPQPYSPTFNDSALNMITIAASSDLHIKGSLLTDFSNFGNKVVDLISPGDKIYSTLPNNEFGYLSGTSMAAPIVTNIAAMIRAYYPKLKASEVKTILIKSCSLPEDIALQNDLALVAKSGGIVNAQKAMEIADEFSKSNKNKSSNKKRATN